MLVKAIEDAVSLLVGSYSLLIIRELRSPVMIGIWIENDRLIHERRNTDQPTVWHLETLGSWLSTVNCLPMGVMHTHEIFQQSELNYSGSLQFGPKGSIVRCNNCTLFKSDFKVLRDRDLEEYRPALALVSEQKIDGDGDIVGNLELHLKGRSWN
jgi:hypothetical protein